MTVIPGLSHGFSPAIASLRHRNPPAGDGAPQRAHSPSCRRPSREFVRTSEILEKCPFFLGQWIGLTPYLMGKSMGKSMVSCRFSLKPIHWLGQNGPSSSEFLWRWDNKHFGLHKKGLSLADFELPLAVILEPKSQDWSNLRFDTCSPGFFTSHMKNCRGIFHQDIFVRFSQQSQARNTIYWIHTTFYAPQKKHNLILFFHGNIQHYSTLISWIPHVSDAFVSENEPQIQRFVAFSQRWLYESGNIPWNIPILSYISTLHILDP